MEGLEDERYTLRIFHMRKQWRVALSQFERTWTPLGLKLARHKPQAGPSVVMPLPNHVVMRSPTTIILNLISVNYNMI